MAPAVAILTLATGAILAAASPDLAARTFLGVSDLALTLICPEANGSSIVNTTAGTAFTIECGLDRDSYDFATVRTYSLAQCIAECAAQDQCVDVSWIPGNAGPCFLKNAIGPARLRQDVWGARLTTAGRPAALSCPSSDGDLYVDPAFHGRQYEVDCDTEYPGMDLMGNPVYVSSLEECIAECDNKSGCQAAVLRGSACYLKSGAQSGMAGQGLLAAKCVAGCQSTSSSNASSTPSASTNSSAAGR